MPVSPNVVTPIIGSDEFPTRDNDVYGIIETLAQQTIRGLKTANILEDALYYYDVENGAVIEEAVIKKAIKQAYDKNNPILSAKDPTIYVRYFNNWEPRQYQTTIRSDDIRKIIANKGTGVEEVVAEILDTLTQGDASDGFKNARDLLLNAPYPDYTPILGAVPTTAKGILYAARDMYNHLRSDNDDLTLAQYESATPEADIRIAMTDKLMNLIDLVELASVFNLQKEELMGKLVVIPTSDFSDDTYWYKLIAYDRKAMARARRLYDYTQDIFGSTRYINSYLTVEEAYFYNGLFKACAIDCSEAAAAALATIVDTTPTTQTVTLTLSHAVSSNTAVTTYKNQPYRTTLSAASGYTLDATGVTTLTMGGTNIKSTALDPDTLEVYIPKVTGDIVIAATGA